MLLFTAHALVVDGDARLDRKTRPAVIRSALTRGTPAARAARPPADSLEQRQRPGWFPGVVKGIRPVAVRAIRGAVQIDANERTAVLDGTTELVTEVMTRNGLATDDVISVVFTATPDLTAEFPALAARKIGFQDVPLLCASEIDVPGAMPRVVRLLMHVETGKAACRAPARVPAGRDSSPGWTSPNDAAAGGTGDRHQGGCVGQLRTALS